MREVAINEHRPMTAATSFAACLATILELALEDVPEPADGEDVAGWQVTTKRCAREGIAGLDDNRRIVVPGRALQAGFAALQHVPSAVKLPITERVLRR